MTIKFWTTCHYFRLTVNTILKHDQAKSQSRHGDNHHHARAKTYTYLYHYTQVSTHKTPRGYTDLSINNLTIIRANEYNVVARE